MTGLSAQWKDSTDDMKSTLPLVGFVLVFAFGLMLVAFRSLVVAVKAIALNLLSVAAYGVLVIVFQYGFAKVCSASARPPGSTRWCRSCCS